jgi:hypothetical protein
MEGFMEQYKFSFNDKVYELREDNCDYILNDEEKPVSGIELSDILGILNQADEIQFDTEYYDQPCENCDSGKQGKSKVFKFLEYYFYIFTRGGKYVISSISKEYGDTSFNKLLSQKSVDNSYAVIIAVCIDCGNYSIEIEQCEI